MYAALLLGGIVVVLLLVFALVATMQLNAFRHTT